MPAKILVLGDSAEAWQRLLESYDYQVSTTVSEREAIAQLTTEKFDLLFVSDSWLEADFLAKLCACAKSTDTLVLMSQPKDGYSGIIRAPTLPNQANGYIVSPFLVEDLVKVFEKLLAGASTQHAPGDEGYVQCEYQEQGWDIVFGHPAFWEVRPFDKDTIRVLGPVHRSRKASAKIVVRRHLPLESESPFTVKDVLNNRQSNYLKFHQVTQERQLQVAGLESQEVEYLWEFGGDHSGRGIAAVVERDGRLYSLSLEAAEDDFDDYRPVYHHLLTSIQIRCGRVEDSVGLSPTRIEVKPDVIGCPLCGSLNELDSKKLHRHISDLCELRAPISSTIHYSRVLLGEEDGPLNDRQREHVNGIYGAAQDLLYCVNSIVDTTELMAGRTILQLESVDLHEIIEESVSPARAEFPARAARLILELADGELRVYADRRRLKQILLILLDNAQRFTDDGSVTIRTERTNRDRQRVAQVTVQDTGIGIAADSLAAVFEPFERLGNTGPGLGLGLTIAKNLVECQGGEIWVESEPGVGSAFSFVLPIIES
jgi:hypothetical protein